MAPPGYGQGLRTVPGAHARRSRLGDLRQAGRAGERGRRRGARPAGPRQGGVLWLYRGRGDGTFAARTKAGENWNLYRDIVGWGDANRDGKPDLYVRRKDGKDAVQYGTGNATFPFSLSPEDPGFLTGRTYRSFH
ncbi:FG-GAP repeat domain-containing protein [Streptomyces sp. NPDC086023]|uniref:FG-GAP repeat domain-containing protein n=1 Tax=Streptomyces sp. NPDC086023 TaxID=3365746 RepID=UPI0037CFA5A9